MISRPQSKRPVVVRGGPVHADALRVVLPRGRDSRLAKLFLEGPTPVRTCLRSGVLSLAGFGIGRPRTGFPVEIRRESPLPSHSPRVSGQLRAR